MTRTIFDMRCAKPQSNLQYKLSALLIRLAGSNRNGVLLVSKHSAMGCNGFPCISYLRQVPHQASLVAPHPLTPRGANLGTGSRNTHSTRLLHGTATMQKQKIGHDAYYRFLKFAPSIIPWHRSEVLRFCLQNVPSPRLWEARELNRSSCLYVDVQGFGAAFGGGNISLF